MRVWIVASLYFISAFSISCASEPNVQHVGPVSQGFLVPTHQLIRPAGQSVEYHGRPVDLVLSPDHRFLYVKNAGDVSVIDVDSWKIVQTLPYGVKGTGASMHGIAISADGKKLFVSTATSHFHEALIAPDGKLTWSRHLVLPGATPKADSYPCGVALSRDGRFAYACLSISNTLAIVDLISGKVVREIPVGMAPYGVALSADDKFAYVTNWGGRRAKAHEPTTKSADSDILVDSRGIACSGTVSIVNLADGREIAQIETGLHPSDLILSADGKSLFIANANSDTVSVVDTGTNKVCQTISVRPDPALPFCSAALALALSPENQTLFVANGGNNAIAVIPLSTNSIVSGFIPTGWYPGALTTDGKYIYAANIKGVGSRDPKDEGKWKSTSYRGSITKVAYPTADQLARYTQQVLADSLVPQTLRAWEKGQSIAKSVPVPEHIGEPSAIDHVLYIIKENRTYDQVMGDMPKGNNDPKLCVYGRKVTPNQHALADEFVLLDNYYCNGVISADGHAWATEGVAVDYLEKSMGAWTRSYPFWGNDPLAFAPTGFIWDNAILHGLTFRNYGEMSTSRTGPIKSTYVQVLHDYQSKTHKITIEQILPNATLKKYSCPDSPGWNLHIPDVIRADVFLREFEDCRRKNQFPNLVTLYLPSNHTSGVNPGAPRPTSMVADNDLAVGRVVEAVSKSQFWPHTCIFIIEDDPQAGFDHVDGHRSVCLVVSPYTRGRGVVSQFYNQTSVLHTMELMLGLPPMNQMDAMAPVMREVFSDTCDTRPFDVLPINYPLDEVNPEKTALSPADLQFAQQSEQLRFDQPDLADEDTLNRILWHDARGSAEPYPSELAGAHGKGLRGLHLKLDRTIKDEDDD